MGDTNGRHKLHLVLFILGGLCTGAGIINLLWSFGWVGGPLNSDHAIVGFSGLDQIAFLDRAPLALGLLISGIVMMVFGNATAWKVTDGY